MCGKLLFVGSGVTNSSSWKDHHQPPPGSSSGLLPPSAAADFADLVVKPVRFEMLCSGSTPRRVQAAWIHTESTAAPPVPCRVTASPGRGTRVWRARRTGSDRLRIKDGLVGFNPLRTGDPSKPARRLYRVSSTVLSG
jgi:hypothetical protein